MSDYASGEPAVQIVAIVASLFLLFLQIALFAKIPLDTLRDTVGAYFIVLAILTIFMELPKKLGVEKLQSPMARVFSQYKDQITRGVWYVIQSIFMFAYMSQYLSYNTWGNNNRGWGNNNRGWSNAHRMFYDFGVCYVVAGVLWAIAGLLSIILKIVRK